MRAPKGREFQVQMRGNIPYIKKDELPLILSDLTEYRVAGRSGRPATVPTAARVFNARVDLDHLKGAFPKEDLVKVRLKHRSLPDLCWQDDVEAIITLERFDGLDHGRAAAR